MSGKHRSQNQSATSGQPVRQQNQSLGADSAPASRHNVSRRQQQQQNLEQQAKLEQRAAIKASFGAEATQLKLAIYFVLAIALVLISIAFFSYNWLEVERRFYGSKFRRLGLWRMCFNSFSAPDDFQFRKFYVGCRWIFADEYKPIRRFLLPGLLNSLRMH